MYALYYGVYTADNYNSIFEHYKTLYSFIIFYYVFYVFEKFDILFKCKIKSLRVRNIGKICLNLAPAHCPTYAKVVIIFCYIIFKICYYTIFFNIIRKPNCQCYLNVTPAYCIKFARTVRIYCCRYKSFCYAVFRVCYCMVSTNEIPKTIEKQILKIVYRNVDVIFEFFESIFIIY